MMCTRAKISILFIVLVGSLLLTLSGSSQDVVEHKVLALTLTGQNQQSGDTVALAHFFIEPESGRWGTAGGWAYWQAEGGYYLRRDSKGIYRVHFLTGEEQTITHIPEDMDIVRAAVSPDGQWVAFAMMTENARFAAYIVRTDGSDQRVLMHAGYTERIWSFDWSEDGQAVEFELQPIYYSTTRYSVRLDDGTITAVGGGYRISPDNQWMAWQVQGYNYYGYVLRLDSGELRKLPDDISQPPIWSPDGWLLYLADDGNIYRERPDDSKRERINQESVVCTRIWWGEYQEWLYVEAEDDMLYRVRADQLGTDLQPVTLLLGEMLYRSASPQNVPDGPWYYFVDTYGRSGDIYRQHAESGELQNLTNHPAFYSRLFWSPEGTPGDPWLYFMSDRDNEQDDLHAIFRMKPDGSELTRLTESTLEPGAWDTIAKTVIRWSDDNAWLEYGPGRAVNCRMRPDGSDQVCLPAPFYEAIPSPDGRWSVVVSNSFDYNDSNIYGVREDDKGNLINLTQQSNSASYRKLTWGLDSVPGGPWLYFESDMSGDWELYRLQPDKSKLENLTNNPGEDTFMGGFWSPEGVVGGPWIYFTSAQAGGVNLYRMQPDGSRVEKLTPAPAPGGYLYAHWSPDQRWLIYRLSDRANVADGYRMRPDGSEHQQTIWFYKSEETGLYMIREETPLDHDRWILEQEVAYSDCTTWTIRLRPANSDEIRITINMGAIIDVDPDWCVPYFRNHLNVGSQYLDGSDEPVIWLPLIVNTD